MTARTIIVGGGIGGFTVAQKLRQGGYEGDVTIIDPEGLPYDRPPLSKEVLWGEKSLEDLHFVPAAWYEANNVTVHTGTVRRIEAKDKAVVLDDDTELTYDRLVLATGGQARRGATPGFTDPGLIVLRTMDDADRLREALRSSVRLGIIGAGLIGAEVAASARQLGAEVTLIDPAPVSLIPAVGEELAHRLQDLHAAHGAAFVNGTTEGVEKRGDEWHITIEGHDDVVVDLVLLSIGLVVDETLADSAGLDCDNGVLVDDEQRSTDPHIWAVGDCARRRHADGTLERRHEHWDSALQEAAAAAASILGAGAPKESAPWFWSDRYGVHVEGVGSMADPGTTVIRNDASGAPAVAFQLREDGTLAGAASYDDSMAVRAARRIIDRGLTPDPEALADPSIPLKKLAR